MWRIFESSSGDLLWRQAMAALRSESTAAGQPGRGGRTREILHAAFALSDPRQRWVSSRRPALNPAFALAEIIWIIRGRRDAEFLSFFNRSLTKFSGTAVNLHGAYGHRLRKHFGFDQLENAYETLRANPNSRQVVMQLWDSKADLPEKAGEPRDPDIPCNTQCLLKVRNGRLEWTQVMRSNDVYLGFPHNLVQFTAVQEVMAGWLELELGAYHHVSDSLHIYERDLDFIATGEDAVPMNETSLALPKLESDRVFSAMEKAVEIIISPGADAQILINSLRSCEVPKAYMDMLRILTAEGLRRRKLAEDAQKIAAECTDPTLSHLWTNWIRRITNSTVRD